MVQSDANFNCGFSSLLQVVTMPDETMEETNEPPALHTLLYAGHVEEKSITFMFSKPEKVGALAEALNTFQSNNISLLHIESRPSKQLPGSYEFLVECECEKGQTNIQKIIEELRNECQYFQIISQNYKDNADSIPWFPRKIQDLDKYCDQLVVSKFDLDTDHPGFNDVAYRKRRKMFAETAINFRHGDKIPKIEYTEDERRTWATVFRKVTQLHKTHACKQYNYVFPLLVENCGYREDNIPHLEDVSNFLKDCTGFTLRPAPGLLTIRNFLASLAFRVLPCTQYIRHPSKPFYTPEPDMIHEILGHAPMFADPAFAEMSQTIGLASLGAPDEDIDKLASFYWFTAEFGVCRQSEELKAYGAGLLGGFEELQYCVSDQPVRKEFDVEEMMVHEYPFYGFQPVYFVANNDFEDMNRKLMEYAKTISRPFSLKYNPYTQTVETDCLLQPDNKDTQDIKCSVGNMETYVDKNHSNDAVSNGI